MRKWVIPGTFNGVASGQTATADLRTIGSYHQLRLQYGTTTGAAARAVMEAEIGDIRLKVGGVTQRVFSVAELFELNEYHGAYGVATGIAPCFFSEPWRRAPAGEDGLAWHMGDVRSFQIEVDLVAGVHTPSLSLTAIREPSNRPMGNIVKWKRYTIPVASVGVHNWRTHPTRDPIYALHCKSADISAFTIKLDEEDIYDNVSVADYNEYLAQQQKTPQTGYQHIDFAATRRVSDILLPQDIDGADLDIKVDFDMGAANAFKVISETVGERD